MKMKPNFNKQCSNLVDSLNSIVSEESINTFGVKQIEAFLLNLQKEIDLQQEIIKHRSMIHELRQQATPKKAKKQVKRASKKNDDEWIIEQTPKVRRVKEEYIDDLPASRKRGPKKAVQMSLPL